MEFKLDNSLGFILSRAALKLKGNFNQALKPFDITTEQWGLLNRLWEKDGVSQRELSEMSFKDQPNITRILDKLEEKGFIERRANPGDRRAFLVYLTAAGSGLKDVLVPAALGSLDRALAGLSDAEVELLKKLLNKIYSNLE